MKPLRLNVFTKLVALITSFAIVPLVLSVGVMIWFHPRIFWPGVACLLILSVISLVAAFSLARHLTRPIRALMRGAERVAQGDFSTVVEVKTHDELEDLAHAFNRMSEDMRRF